MIIGVTGLAASGKQVVADYLREKHGFAQLDFAKDALFAEAQACGLELTKMNLSILGDELRAQGGNGVLAKTLLKKMPTGNVVITGFRSPEEVDCIRNEAEEFCLIEVFAEPATRFSRRRPDDPQNEQEFFSRDERDINNKGLGKVLEIADARLDNNGSLEELSAKISELMKKIEEKKL